MRGAAGIVAVFIFLLTLVLNGCGSLGGHLVRKGETLYSISFRYGHDYRQVARWNSISPPYIISPGQNIRITPPQNKPGSLAKSVAQVPTIIAPVLVAEKKQVLKQRPQVPQANTIIVVTKPAAPVYPKKVLWQWPVKGKIIQRFSADRAGRKGIDIVAANGTIIKAAASGRVVYAGEGLASYGKLIIIKHNEQFLSAYAHNRKILVTEGQDIKMGTPIAEMGRSGTDRVKLHFEVRRKGKPYNPLWYLPKR